jgi:hypothetical protein
MRRAIFLPALMLAAAFGATAAHAQRGVENRCGWYENPTPANHWLTDGTRQWIIGTQGGFQARGIERIPDLSSNSSRWIATHPNGSYGYGCVCMGVRTDRRNGRITQIHSARSVPLAQCRRDRRLREPRG